MHAWSVGMGKALAEGSRASLQRQVEITRNIRYREEEETNLVGAE